MPKGERIAPRIPSGCLVAFCGSEDGKICAPRTFKYSFLRMKRVLTVRGDEQATLLRHKALRLDYGMDDNWKARVNQKVPTMHDYHFKDSAFTVGKDGQRVLRKDYLQHTRSRAEIEQVFAEHRAERARQEALLASPMEVQIKEALGQAVRLPQSQARARKNLGVVMAAQHVKPVRSLATNDLDSNQDVPLLLKQFAELKAENERLKKENMEVRGENEGLRGKLAAAEAELREAKAKKPHLRVEQFENNDSAITVFTSLDSYERLRNLTETFAGEGGGLYRRERPGARQGSRPELDRANRVFLTLFWLRLGMSQEAISLLFGIKQKSVSNYIADTLPLLARFFRNLFPFPKKEIISQTSPAYFKETLGFEVFYTMDGTEIPLAVSSNRSIQNLTYSNHHHQNAAKVLVVVTPSGYFWVSDAYAGRASDSELVVLCDVLEMIEPGCTTLVDRGFTANAMAFLQKGCVLVAPTRLTKSRTQFQAEEIGDNTKKAHLRIHVERVINMLKEYVILQKPLPVDFWKMIDDIVQVARGLCLLRTPMTISKEKMNS